MNRLGIAIVLLFVTTTLSAQNWNVPENNPEELGDVNWIRNYDQALKTAKKEKKPIFILFQEVPGCSTCRNYGNDILSDPLIVEAIESEFVPLCIYNNLKGHDRKILEKYNEPTWNNPVVRIVDNQGSDIVDRVSGNYSKQGIIDAIMDAMQSEGNVVPTYIQNLETEYTAVNTDELVLGMYCFWSGEKALAEIPGVIKSQAGFMNGSEVVKLVFDKDKISSTSIVSKAKSENCADVVFSDSRRFKNVKTKKSGKFRGDKESKYYLYKSPYKSIPMTPYQQLKANHELSQGGDISYILSPRQLALWKIVKKNNWTKNYIDVDLASAWNEVVMLTDTEEGE